MKQQSKGFIARNRSTLLGLTFCGSLGSGLFAFWWRVRDAFGMIGRGTLEVLTFGRYDNPASPQQAAVADTMVAVGVVGTVVFGVLFFYVLLAGWRFGKK
ncbi:hypothetical protein [Profundibacter amoris]|uniref:Uncharacterized protein n=1 Tax=Profundibacter amoris TaxID=2171755 RepID=A0A347UI26_9RHOB|nr:hypothetical protein [Profundibacter amoris]AXX98504.1 hypothetical protein BAR1_11580 [Profundibacter amoris]